MAARRRKTANQGKQQQKKKQNQKQKKQQQQRQQEMTSYFYFSPPTPQKEPAVASVQPSSEMWEPLLLVLRATQARADGGFGSVAGAAPGCCGGGAHGEAFVGSPCANAAADEAPRAQAAAESGAPRWYRLQRGRLTQTRRYLPATMIRPAKEPAQTLSVGFGTAEKREAE